MRLPIIEEDSRYKNALNLLQKKYPDRLCLQVDEVRTLLGLSSDRQVYNLINRKDNPLPAKKCGKIYLISLTNLAHYLI